LKTKALIAFAAFVLIAGCGKKEGEVAQEQPAQQQLTEQKQPAQTPPAVSGIPQVPGDTITTASGLKYIEMTIGTGELPNAGQLVQFHYTGWLTDGTKFDSSRDKGQPYTSPLSRLAKGVGEGLASMKIGGRRLLIIPPDLGYGPRGAGGDIPPNATLVFDVELVGLQPSGEGQ
jgi:peptidylprolyl isomerase